MVWPFAGLSRDKRLVHRDSHLIQWSTSEEGGREREANAELYVSGHHPAEFVSIEADGNLRWPVQGPQWHLPSDIDLRIRADGGKPNQAPSTHPTEGVAVRSPFRSEETVGELHTSLVSPLPPHFKVPTAPDPAQERKIWPTRHSPAP